jgi:hypothetical protein
MQVSGPNGPPVGLRRDAARLLSVAAALRVPGVTQTWSLVYASRHTQPWRHVSGPKLPVAAVVWGLMATARSTEANRPGSRCGICIVSVDCEGQGLGCSKLPVCWLRGININRMQAQQFKTTILDV